jgi:hypothetical protein
VLESYGGTTDVNVFVVADGIEIQLSAFHGHMDMIRSVADVQEFGVGIFLESLGNFAEHGQIVTRLIGGLTNIAARGKAKARGYGGGGNPEVHVRAAGTGFVDIYTDYSFVKDPSTHEGQRGSRSNRSFGDK